MKLCSGTEVISAECGMKLYSGTEVISAECGMKEYSRIKSLLLKAA